MKRDLELEAAIVQKFVAVEPVIDERRRRLWAAAESRAIGYGGDALVSAATGLARTTIRAGRRELDAGIEHGALLRRAGGGRPSIESSQPGVTAALEKLVDRHSGQGRLEGEFYDGGAVASRTGLQPTVSAKDS